VELTDTVQRSTPFQEFLGDGEHPLAFSVDPFDVVLVPVEGRWGPYLVFSSIDHDLLTSLIQSLIDGAASWMMLSCQTSVTRDQQGGKQFS
jgi:hypothetical protein